ncbi:mechanosensitive ion channel family protein [Seonamhaeicola marinus]|uniref:Mechanosensing system component YbdG n=1 Tax=Seonamhaeicola marinus TaxID=1912246 RepID=A0A5D0HKW2_9FLAO|nr:mechanosensitive ion channel domain-containing protein [Seonamhaeicola marinus]TYA71928.1 mechanosensitive ion channel [Seonamhaeicola marinus]
MIQDQVNTVTENVSEVATEAFELKSFLYDKLIANGFSEDPARYLNMIALLISLVILVFMVDFIVRKILLNMFTKFAQVSKSNFDDLLVKNKVPKNIAHILPLLLALHFIPDVFFHFDSFEIIVEKGLQVFAIVLALWIVRSLLHTVKDFLKTLPRLKDKPIESYIQVFMIFAWVAGIMSAIAVITNTPFLQFLTGLGAISAIIILVFKDTILGFVASIQVSINDMVRIGDWVTFEKFGADGDVIEITLATVKVQNFDKTITTIPTYALISESFKNWRGMSSSEGRRIKRSVNIKTESVKYLSPDDVTRLKGIQIISDYLTNRQTKIDDYNTSNNIDKSLALNGRNLTNIGVFRKYVQTYIENHSAINKDMTIMVRQLAPTTQGLPLEIYAFSSDKRWENYESIMGDIFDHVIAAIPYFDLEVFELPSNSSFSNLN